MGASAAPASPVPPVSAPAPAAAVAHPATATATATATAAATAAAPPPRQPVSPTRVAKGFVAVYYRVAASAPHRLAELFGAGSHLHHGHAYRAAGTHEIAALASSLPLACAVGIATIASLTAQYTASGGYVVTVVGTFSKARGEASVFSQTFVLEKQTDSHDDHFYCSNDMFVDVDAAPLPGLQPSLDDLKQTTDEESTTAQQEQSHPAPTKPSATQHQQPRHAPEHAPANPPRPAAKDPAPEPRVPVVPAPAPHPLPPQAASRDLATLQPRPADPPVSAAPLAAADAPEPVRAATPPAAVNVSRSPQRPVVEKTPPPPDQGATEVQPRGVSRDASPAKQQKAKQEDPPHSPASSAPLPNGSPKEGETQPPERQPAPPVKKTWASIVSSQEAAAAVEAQKDAAQQAIPVAVQNTTQRVQVAQKQAVQDATEQPPVTEHVENIPPTSETDAPKGNGPMHANVAAQRPAANAVQNGHRPSHISGRGGHQRTFGPSAVVQLGSLSPAILQDPKALTGDLRQEFGQYGFKPRHVEVKVGKGIAFVEYETSEGVRAAVAAWANGPRAEGKFAGIPLNVSEKRPYNKWRPGSMRGGGRGGPRGSRRHRPASTPMS